MLGTDVHYEPGFVRWVEQYHALHGRHELPWRLTAEPYPILVSEIMLQQTQVERVIPKFLAFLNRFPTVKSLAQAKLAEVLTYWQGLGYNRRGKNLWLAARMIADQLSGQFPQTTKGLLALPGVGPYTAAAIMAFAFNQPAFVLETNVRTVFLHHFFPQQEKVPDKELSAVVQLYQNHPNPRMWNAALMDYGSYLKSVLPNPTRRSTSYTKQSTFIGSLRRVRGSVLRQLTRLGGNADEKKLKRNVFDEIAPSPEQCIDALQSLEKDGMIHRKKINNSPVWFLGE